MLRMFEVSKFLIFTYFNFFTIGDFYEQQN
jgi:hypothetical protein